MTKKSDAEFREKQEKALEILAEKDPQFDADIAATNERLAAGARTDKDFVQASIDLNNPVGTHAAMRDPKEEKKVAEAKEKAAAALVGEGKPNANLGA
jgi:ABC-type transporter Mla subunit MlaD